MSGDYSSDIARINGAHGLDDIKAVARTYSAAASGEGGILYSRAVGGINSEAIALELADKTGLPVINHTPRARFLSNPSVQDSIEKAAMRIFESEGMSAQAAEAATSEFLYGNAQAAARSSRSLEGCLWGEASEEFARSLRGDVRLVASDANLERVFGKVELPTVLDNPRVASLGGQPVAKLRGLYESGGAQAVLPEVQAGFIRAAPEGIFVAPTELGNRGARTTLSREFAESMGVDASRFRPAAELSTSEALVRAPIGMDAQVAAHEARILAQAAVPKAPVSVEAAAPKGATVAEEAAIAERAAAKGVRPGLAGKGLGIVGAAATVYDIGDTAHDVTRLQGQGNATAAQARIERFAVQNAAGWGGAVAGMGVGAAAGVETGPGLLLTGAIGGIVGAVAGDKVADWLNDRKINRQDDASGNTWAFDPEHPDRGWTRTEGGLLDRLQGQTRTLTADAALSDRLTRQASNASIELALGSPPQSRDPYTLPAAAGDTRSLQRSDWSRDPGTGAWRREVVDQYLEHGLKASHTETADPQRAAQLERQSQAITEANAAHTPAAMAAQFQAAYERNGWSRHGAMPAAVGDALRHPGRIVASDGNLYERDAQGGWTHDGTLWDSRADGNVLRELEATYRAQQQAREPKVTARSDAAIPGGTAGAGRPGNDDARTATADRRDGREAATDAAPHRLAPMVERLGLAALDTPGKVGQVAGSLENAGLRDRVDVQRVAASRDQSVVFGIQGDPAVAGGYRQTHVRVDDALAMTPQALAREHEDAQAQARQRDQQQTPTREGQALA